MMKKHVHKYERVEAGKKGWVIFKCMLPGCTHFLPVAKMMVNRMSLCWGICDGLAIYTQRDYEVNLKHPMCEPCREIRKNQREEMLKIA